MGVEFYVTVKTPLDDDDVDVVGSIALAMGTIAMKIEQRRNPEEEVDQQAPIEETAGPTVRTFN